MKTLKNILILSLIIFLIGFTACDKYKFENPAGPDIPPLDSPPPDPPCCWTAEAEFTGEQITLTTCIWEITLNSVKATTEIVGCWLKPEGKFIVVELKVKNVENSDFPAGRNMIPFKQYTIEADGVSYEVDLGGYACFPNYEGDNIIIDSGDTNPSDEYGYEFFVLAFDLPVNTENGILKFHDNHNLAPETTIIFHLSNLAINN